MSGIEILVEALHYIREFHGETVVVKSGGHAMVDEETMDRIARDLVLMRYVGIKPVLVHGGGPEISRVMERMGKKPEMVEGIRVTDQETLEIARMALIGNVGTKMVADIWSHGGRGVGLSGKDGGLFVATRKGSKRVSVAGEEREVDLGYVGEIRSIDTDVVDTVTERGYIPVVSPIALDEEGGSLNVNADEVAGELAQALEASKLIMITDVPGVLRDVDDPSSLISELTVPEARQAVEDGTVREGMVPKVEACIRAVASGMVDRSHIIDGTRPHSLLEELFTEEGAGTMIARRAKI